MMKRMRSFAVVLAAVTAMIVGAGATTAAAGEPAQTSHAVLLAPALPEAPPAVTARGAFYQRTISLTLPGASVRLAASPDGQGALCTDDQATIQFVTGGMQPQVWSHRFAGADRRAITCIPPQQMALSAGPGAYRVSVLLEDLFPDTYSTRPYYLVFDAVAPAPTSQATPAAAPATPAPTAAAMLFAVAPTFAAAVPTLRPAPTAGDVATPPQGSTQYAPTPAAPFSTWLLPALALAAALCCGLAIVVWRRRAPATPAIAGIVDLFDQGTREARTEFLPAGAGVFEITCTPLRLTAPGAREQAGVAVARLLVTAEGVALEDLTPSSGTADAIPLQNDTPYRIAGGAVTLRYRSLLAPAQTTGAPMKGPQR